MNHVRMFKPQFADAVRQGTKRQTVRPIPVRLPKAGDRISLRMWSGKPYRSKQTLLRETMVISVSDCCITGVSVTVRGREQDPEIFARADGFDSFATMRQWFLETHGLPFQGILIEWQ